MRLEHWWYDAVEKTNILGENISKCYCVHHKFHMDWSGGLSISFLYDW